MYMTLQESIDYAANQPPPDLYGIEVYIAISMHDEAGIVLMGGAYGFDAMFRHDLPLMHPDVATIAGGGPTVTVGGVPTVPGFSTRDGAGRATLGTIPIDFSVRRDPGTSLVDVISGAGPSVQIEIETLSPAPPGTVTGAFKLEVAEDGALLRAVGPSLKTAAAKASYTATVEVHERPG